jgi:hypothetical protein
MSLRRIVATRGGSRGYGTICSVHYTNTAHRRRSQIRTVIDRYSATDLAIALLPTLADLQHATSVPKSSCFHRFIAMFTMTSLFGRLFVRPPHPRSSRQPACGEALRVRLATLFSTPRHASSRRPHNGTWRLPPTVVYPAVDHLQRRCMRQIVTGRRCSIVEFDGCVVLQLLREAFIYCRTCLIYRALCGHCQLNGS